MNSPDAFSDRSAELSDRLARQLNEFDVPGAAFALARGDDMSCGAAGLLSRETGLAVTTDSWFQIGSITKVFTATLVMQLVDDGLVALDEPIRTYLPHFDVGDDTASREITVRHLLTHTSGIQGDYFADFGRGLDATSRYVDSLPDVGMLHRPGELVTYCNSGFCVLGVLIETLRGSDYDTVLTERVLAPLGIAGGTVAEQAMLHRAAVGHMPPPSGGAAMPVQRWALPYAMGPAGATVFMDVAGLLAFARMHLADGLAPDGTRVLSSASVAEMQRCQFPTPHSEPIFGVGASWFLQNWGDEVVIGHDGGTIGQFSLLLAHPRSGSIAAMLTNGPGGAQLFETFLKPLFAELTGLPIPATVVPPATSPRVDIDRLVGRYAHCDAKVEVLADGDHVSVTLSSEANAALGESESVAEFAMTPHSASAEDVVLITTEPVNGTHIQVVFPAPGTAGSGPAGRPSYLRFASRAYSRLSS